MSGRELQQVGAWEERQVRRWHESITAQVFHVEAKIVHRGSTFSVLLFALHATFLTHLSCLGAVETLLTLCNCAHIPALH